MLRLFLGENQSAKLKTCAEEMNNILSVGGKVAAIIPDQFSFAFDKSLYAELGARRYNDVTVLSFRRLATSLIDKYGTQSGRLVKPDERLILIYIALRKVRQKKSLRIFARASEKPNFAADMSVLIDSLCRCGITPGALSEASEKARGSLSDKLADLSDIYAAYLELLGERSVRDESSVISEGADIADKNSAFRGLHVYVDRFESFSPDEIKMLRAILRDAESLTVNLSMPMKTKRSTVSPYAVPTVTQNKLIDLAKELSTPVTYLECPDKKTFDPQLLAISGALFLNSCAFPEGGTVRVVRADTLSEEADFAAAEILHLVTKEGYRFNDIAVITHDIDVYGEVLEASFERFGVEAFIDRTRPASGMSLVLFSLDALEAASTRKPDTDKLIKYLRSPFSPLTADESSALWDYCTRWNVAGDMWLSDFTAGEADILETVNAERRKAIEPINALRDRTKNATAGEISGAFCDFLRDIQLGQKASLVIEDCVEPELRLETARLFKQLWNAIMNAVSSIYKTAKDEKMTLRAYAELFRLVLSQTAVSSPPQKLDSVTVADVSRSIISSPRAVFVVGLNDGLFPKDIKKMGLFSGRDLAELESMGISFDASPEASLAIERFDCYNALTSASERLYMCFSGADLRGAEMRPSRYVTRVCELLNKKPENAATLGVELYCQTPEAAYYTYNMSRRISKVERESLRLALVGVPEYAERLYRLDGLKNRMHRLSPKVSRELFSKNSINVTASRIDVYNRCNYEYFCKYGLKLEPIKPLTVDPANRGTVMHFIFQSVLEYYGERFSEIDDAELSDLIKKLLDEYLSKNLGGDFGKTKKFEADYNRLGSAAFEILVNMREEFKVSKFRPERFEYDLSEKDGSSILSIPVGGTRVNIRGVVDRVDIYTAPDGKRYIRVVDYKTGEKKLSFEDLYNGINMQLLLYMLALTEGRNVDFKSCVPAGILYMRSGFLECKDDYDPLNSEQKSRLERSTDQLRRNGLIITDSAVIEAMDETLSGKYIPVKFKKDGEIYAKSEVISRDSFMKLEEFAKKKVAEFGIALLSGKIDAVPSGIDPEHLRCAYCDYYSVCDRKKYMYKLVEREDADRLKAEIEMTEEAEDV